MYESCVCTCIIASGWLEVAGDAGVKLRDSFVRLQVPAQTGTVGKWQTLETGNMGATQRSRVDQERFALTQGRYDGMRVSRQGSRASS